MILNFKKNNKPRRTICQICNDVLINGEDNLDRGVNIVTCPKCHYVKLMESGMVPEQMIQDNIIHRSESGVEGGWGVGLNVQIKGLPDFELVLTEEQISAFQFSIDASRKEMRDKLKGLK